MNLPKSGFLACLFISLLITGISRGQSLYEVSLDEKISHAGVIIEGRVASKNSFWNPEHSMIFTANSIEVYKIFRGNISGTQVEIITQGGSVDNQSIQASDLLNLDVDETGIFFCFPQAQGMKSPVSGKPLLDVYSSSQGFFQYDLANKSASAPFVRYADIQKDLYADLIKHTGQNYINLKPGFDVNIQPSGLNQPNAPSVSSFSPATVNAGAILDPANNILTINGSGFGTATGSAAVLFDDANNGTGGTPYTVTATDPLIISWGDTQIQLRVPSRAGTGIFSVRDAGGVTANSPTPLQVLYAVITATFVSGGTYVKESNLMNDNGSGGYTILYSTNTAGRGVDFNAAPEKATFQRALTTWKEICGFNVAEGGTTSIQAIAGDGSNIVVFDNDNAGSGITPLAAGVLAVCYSYNSICLPVATNNAQKTEFDIIVRNAGVSSGSTAFQIGPCPPMSSNFSEIDLETVLLHELGHALNLAHINDSYQGSVAGQLNPGKLMNYAVVNSVKRVTPDYSAKSGADYCILQQGNAYGSCGLSSVEMTPLATTAESKDECPASFPSSKIPNNTTISFDLVHATSNRFVDPDYTQLNCSATGTGITNTAYYAFKTNSVGGILTINVANYNTVPSLPATCATPYGYATKGVELSLYQVPSCPLGQNFPAPVACRSFDGNGALSDFTGLLANTTYLLLVDGIENTKATFDLNFSGASLLPFRLSDFSGVAIKDKNKLSWAIESASGIGTVWLEKSNDGIHFAAIHEIGYPSGFMKGEFLDTNPFPAENYYRLLFENADGPKEYSKVILLKRKGQLELMIFPNPAGEWIGLDFRGAAAGNYTAVLMNTMGQIVSRKQMQLAGGSQMIRLNIGDYSPGQYQLSLYNSQNQLVETKKITIRR